MAELSEILEIGSDSLELLEVAGIRDTEHLARQKSEFLTAELEKANDSFSILKSAPGQAAVEKWISIAMEIATAEAEEEVEQKRPADEMPVNHESGDELAEMLESAPFAIPLSGKIMMERKLRVGDIPAGLLLNGDSGKLGFRTEESDKPKTDVPARRGPGIAESMTTREQLRHFDTSQLKAIVPEPGAKRKRAVKSKDSDEQDRVGLIRAPREKTNRGKDPKSRGYVRGVLHTHPWSLRIGAASTLMILIILPAAFVSTLLLLLSRESSQSFAWVPEWVLVFPIALPVFGILYLLWGLSGKCRICNQKIFAHQRAFKHVKAHRIRGLGFVVPLCLHLLLFSWFRCSSCGTPVRLKK